MRSTVTVLALIGVFAAGVAAQDELALQLDEIVKSAAPTVVTVRGIMKMEFFGNAQEVPVTTRGVLVSEDGLILGSASRLSPPQSPEGRGPKMALVELKVVVGNEDQEYSAFVAATEKKFDLAFIQIKGLGERKLVPLALDHTSKPSVGDRVACVSRLDKGFDYAPYFLLGRINGQIKKPRKAFITDGLGVTGLPVYALDGTIVGFSARLESGAESGGGGGGIEALLGMSGGAPSGQFVIPAKVIGAKVAQAQKRAQEMLAEEDGDKEEEKKDGK